MVTTIPAKMLFHTLFTTLSSLGHASRPRIENLFHGNTSAGAPLIRGAVLPWMNYPLQRFRHKFGVSHPRTSGPVHQRLIAVAHIADVLGLVLVNDRIRITEPDRSAQLFYVFGLTR